MSSRTIVTVILAIILVIMVMAVSAAMAFSGWVGTQAYKTETAWQTSFNAAQSMKIIDLDGSGNRSLFVQNQDMVRIYDAAGKQVYGADFPAPVVSTLGDVTGDNVDDVIVFSPQGSGTAKATIISKGQVVREWDVANVSVPARTAVVRFASGPQIIFGDDQGSLVAFHLDGSEAWRGAISAGDAVRGLDDAVVQGKRYLAAANHNGEVALFDDQGQALWNYSVGSTLRRLRAYDLNGDGVGELLIGADNGRLQVLNAADGQVLQSIAFGQPVTEIREAELDGDPASREFVAGGKDGGVGAYHLDGSRLWSASVSEKVTEIAADDLDKDGRDEVYIGNDSGTVNLFTGPSGDRHEIGSFGSTISRLDAGRLSDSRQVVIADANTIRVDAVKINSLPALKFTPLLVGLVISALIIGAAWFISTLPGKAPVQVAIEDQTAEGLRAQRRMLKENIADVERLRQSGEMAPDAYLLRLKDLRGQLAANEAATLKAVIKIAPETMACPHCGGTIQLGADKCDYCGQVVIA